MARRWVGSKHVRVWSVVVVLLLAAEVSYVVDLKVPSSATPKSAAARARPPSTKPRTTVPPTVPPTSTAPTTVPPTTVPPTTAPPTTVPTSQPVTAATASSSVPVTYCTASDLAFSTTTDQSSYRPGEAVDMTTTVTDVTSCTFQPLSTSSGNCLVVNQAAKQVFPSANQPESCTLPPGQTMEPGATERISGTWAIPPDWDLIDLSRASYQAVGEWAWSAGPGQSPNTFNSGSATFSVG